MRKLTLAIVGLAALVASSVAVAHGIGGTKTVKAVSATFAANPGRLTTRTCTTSDNKTIVTTDGTYTGTAGGDSDLAGPIVLRTHSVFNQTDNVGMVNGSFRVNITGRGGTKGTFSGVLDHTSLVGFAVGHVYKGGTVLANLSSTFTQTAGFSAAKLGGGTSGGSAVEIATGACKAPSPAPPSKSEAHGPITAVSPTSITVAGLTCDINPPQADMNTAYKTGDVVEIKCAVHNGHNTLVRIKKNR